MTRILPEPRAEAGAVGADGPPPTPALALVRSVPFAEGRFFVLSDETGRPLAVLAGLRAAHRVARLLGFRAHTVH